QLLREDTLYVLNRSCDSYLNDRILDSLLMLHYRFSLYRIIQTEEIDVVKAKNNSCFFALIGEFYSGEQEPLTTGIFLLDSGFELVDYPFPVFTMYPSRRESCFKDFEKTARMIHWFSNRLYKRSDMH